MLKEERKIADIHDFKRRWIRCYSDAAWTVFNSNSGPAFPPLRKGFSFHYDSSFCSPNHSSQFINCCFIICISSFRIVCLVLGSYLSPSQLSPQLPSLCFLLLFNWSSPRCAASIFLDTLPCMGAFSQEIRFFLFQQLPVINNSSTGLVSVLTFPSPLLESQTCVCIVLHMLSKLLWDHMHNSLLCPLKSPTTWSFYNLSAPFLQMTPEP